MLHAYTRMVCSHCGETIDVPLFCGDRFCPVCSVVRRSRVRRRLMYLIMHRSKDPAFRLFHLTLTISSGKSLADMVSKINRDFRRLRQRAYWKLHVDGGAFVTEITGRPGAWHAHIHAVISSRWMKWEHVRDLWRKVSKGIGVYITIIPEIAAVGYLTKYLSKPDVPEVVQAEMTDALRKVRLFAPFGSWHGENKKYKSEAAPCRNCGQGHWQSWDMMQGEYPRARCKDFDVGKPLIRKEKAVAA